MKKLDILVTRTFLSPFLLTFSVVVFILLLQYMLKYFDDFVGKGLGPDVFAELIMYFSINMTPVALPLAILLSSLMTFGNLGEHFELTAMKSAGISLTRILVPLFGVVVIIAILAYFSNNYLVPRANLNAYSLLYDIKHKKPSFDLKEGVFYNGIPGYRIKVNEKFEDGKTLKDIIIYDHTGGAGNNEVVIADSGQMYTINQGKYLVLDLYNGNSYSESTPPGVNTAISYNQDQFVRNQFTESKMIFSLSSFDLKRTDKELFSTHRRMKLPEQLESEIDSLQNSSDSLLNELKLQTQNYYTYQFQDQKDNMNTQSRETDNLPAGAGDITPDYDSLPTGKGIATVALKGTDTTGEKQVPDKRAGQPQKKEKATKLPPSARRLSPAAIRRKSERLLNPALEREEEPRAASVKAVAKKSAANNKLSEALKVSADTPVTVNEEANTADLIQSYATDTAALPGHRGNENDTIAGEELSGAALDKLVHIIQQGASKNLRRVYSSAVSQSRYIKNNIQVKSQRIFRYNKKVIKVHLEHGNRTAQAVMCLVMFLIGAPLGAIIKKGGLGVPVLISIGFFIISYVLTNSFNKYAEEEIVSHVTAIWMPNIILLPFGVFFLVQARRDARLLEVDAYKQFFNRVAAFFRRS